MKKMPCETYKKSVFEKGPILENTLRMINAAGKNTTSLANLVKSSAATTLHINVNLVSRLLILDIC